MTQAHSSATILDETGPTPVRARLGPGVFESESARRAPVALASISEGNLINRESTQPVVGGHTTYEATDFLDTVPWSREESAEPSERARPASSKPLERALARHESASTALSAAIGAAREVASPPVRLPQAAQDLGMQRPSNVIEGLGRPGSPAAVLPQSPVRDAPAPAGETPRAQRALPRPAELAPATALPTRLAFERERGWAASSSPFGSPSIENMPWADRSVAGCRPIAAVPHQRATASRAPGTPSLGHAAMLALCVALAVAVAFKARRFALRPEVRTPVPVEASKTPPSRPEAPVPCQEAACSVATSGPAVATDIARASTPAAQPAASSDARIPAAPPSRQEPGSSGNEHRIALDSPQQSGRRHPDRGVAASSSVAAAIEAAQAKADAFLREDMRMPPEHAQAEASPTRSARAADLP